MAKLTFRVRKEIKWDGKVYLPGNMLEIEEGNTRLRALLEQSHHLEYANQSGPANEQKVSESSITTIIG